MPSFYITFGQKYRHEPHPLKFVHPDGYVKIVAKDLEAARKKIFELCGEQWACLYYHKPKSDLFPKGLLKTYNENSLIDWLRN